MIKYNSSKIEKKWQKYWEAKKFYAVKDKATKKENLYFLVEFPYPSGDLHIGHWYAFSVPDIAVRYWRMKGKNVMYPIGFDAFGLPAENAAIKNNLQPEDWTRKNIAYMTKQLKSMGAAFDWSRAVSTMDLDYYKWTQWIFLQFYKKGLAYRAKTFVNWCPKDKTVLANEQVINGCCDRCGTEVVQKEMFQWMYKITDYADKLIDDLEKVDWPKVTKTAQRNWIGRSRGAEIHFLLPNSTETIKVFTTRADTLYGATYIVLAPEHSLITKLTKDQYLDSVSRYLETTKKKSELERLGLEKDPPSHKATEGQGKTGVFTGAYAVNPINNEKIPIWVADYVIGWYGTGAVMAVPAHDERDFEFAKKFKLPMKQVIKELSNMGTSNVPSEHSVSGDSAYEGDGVLVDSREFTGFKSEDAREEIVEKLAKKGLAERKTNYKLHDWVLSRQRYWGTPIPMINCPKCGYKPVPEKDLPVKLPKLDDYKPSTDGRSPLAKAKEWLKVKCPNCGGKAERETDTMDTFVDSSWYFLRYADPHNKKAFADSDKMKNWLPVDLYVGGAEHNTMHLLYSRFFTKAMYDLGLLEFNEPFVVRRNHGIILGPDNQKMSKSRGNVINPDDLVKKYGADAVRMYLAFMGPYEQGGPWNPGGIIGISRFMERVRNLLNRIVKLADTWSKNYREDTSVNNIKSKKESLRFYESAEGNIDLSNIFHKTIKKVSEDIEKLSFNTAVSALMILLNSIQEETTDISPGGFKVTHTKTRGISKPQLETFLRLLAPFVPHLTEELWMNTLGNKKSIHLEKWPEYDPKLIVEETIKLVVQVNGKARDVIEVMAGLDETAAREVALGSENIKKHIAGTEIKKIIFVKNRLINFII
ncbi:MAG: leucine--tRNA ligase [Candidatus Yanofskybacteria bacterium]|nr:leucine--tRNA ligase [Candidatus Yanofskybacteria bacterium]